MKKYIRTGLLFAAFAAAISACKDDDEILVTPELEVGVKKLSFDEQTTQTLAIEANGAWSVKAIKDSASFIVTPEKGYGNGEVTITLDRAKTTDIDGYLKITYLDGTDEGLQVARGVKMTAKGIDMSVSTQDVAFTPRIKYVKTSIGVNWSGKWTAELSDTTWYSIDRTSGEGNEAVNVSIKEKAYKKAKEAALYIAPVEYPKAKIKINLNRNDELESGKYVTLNKASVGKGIDIVFVGDFFTEEDLLPGGAWEEALNRVNQWLFRWEPMKSYQDWFNVYAVADTSSQHFPDLSGETDYETPFATFNGEKSTWSDGSKKDAWSMSGLQMSQLGTYAMKHTPVLKDKGTMIDMSVVLLPNTMERRFGGKASMWSSINFDLPKGATLMAIMEDRDYTIAFSHELWGHVFGWFGENYPWRGSTSVLPDTTSLRKDQRTLGKMLDIEVVEDPVQFNNRAWAELLEMGYRNVYQCEGGGNFGKGVWRSSWLNIMCGGAAVDGYDYFSPVQRELLLRTIYRLGGKESEYSLQTFLDYDVINEELDRKKMEQYPIGWPDVKNDAYEQ